MRSFLAACVVASFALTGCAVNVDRDDAENEADTTENAGALSTYGNQLVGAYETTAMEMDFNNLVLKADGTYFSTENIVCITTPCDPIRDQGKFIGYKPAKGSKYGGLRLVSTKGKSTYYRVLLTAPNESFQLAKSGTSKFYAFTSTDTFCQTASDCDGQSYIHVMCVGYRTCDATKSGNRCGYKCGAEPPKCDYTNPAKRYVGKSPDACAVIRYTCDFAAGETSFSDACGCGCAVPKKPTLPACKPGGCSGQICTDKTGLVTTCEWREQYACYQKLGVCERGADGTCGWRDTNALEACLESHL